ncbi:DNA annealing helicase and endonuclease ZRANB3 [Bagarius yarrelli]|uniref:DNA annealing helicase and endonuclease ZRANB3 n=1 Tax=Bagarius yarrelli TaxID=175774 RepID=A0A556TTU6_BAGYA|nr:DNA annealing helicase and endonuclease ZRANB3 [Bagarius yarrelli]
MPKGELKGRDAELLVLPEKLEKRLLKFQRDGVKFALSKAGRCLIADEVSQFWVLKNETLPVQVACIRMGLGKTVQAISVAYLYRQEWPLLIVVPSSLKYPWIEELERWIPELGPDDINLVESKADIMMPCVDLVSGLLPRAPVCNFRGITQSKVTVLGYGLLTNDAQSLVEALKKQHFGVVIVDESHYMKSRNAARTKILVPVIQSAKRAILLTGTPALGRPEELFMQIDALYPRRFGTWSEYAKKYCNAHYRFFGRRRQWDCRGASHLDELHQRLGEIMIRRLKAEVLTQLPAKIRQRIPFDLTKEAAKSENENPFTEVMGLITQMYKQTAVAKAGYIRIDGSVPSAERIQLVHRFQNDPETRVAILSIQAAGQGLTLTAASHVVFAELYWNPGHVKQAEDRAHRIGQTSSVHVHYLIAKGTFDMVMWAMLNRKETVTGSTLNGRKDYLKAEEADKDKWDFLNFAQAWTPSDSITGQAEDEKDGVFFSHFEKDKQHDIRNFFSPATDKKRKRTDDSESLTSSPQTPSQDQQGTNQSPCSSSPDLANQDADFCSQIPALKQMQIQLPRSPPASPSLSASLSVPSPCITLSHTEEDNSTPKRLQAPLGTHSQTEQTSEACRDPAASKFNQFIKGDYDQALIHKDTLFTATTPSPPQTVCPAEIFGFCPRANDSRESETVDESLPVYDSLKFCASKNTDRIYIYDKDGLPLNCNFVPLDIRLQNWEDLPPEFSRTENRRHLVRFVREWSFLTAMKQRIVRKSGKVFQSPILLVDELSHTQRRHSSTKRQERVRTHTFPSSLSPPLSLSLSICSLMSKAPFSLAVYLDSEAETGYVQALDSAGTPLCLSCQKPSVEHSGWAGGFCSASCMEDLQLRSSRGYARSRVLETEQGVCQSCGLNAHQLYLRVRDAPNTHRKEILDNTWLSQLPLKQLNEMIRHPVEGHFWQVDHIMPVYSGGGQCLLDNLQTLCTVCHRMRTAQQAKERSQLKKDETASKLSSDITRFFMRK